MDQRHARQIANLWQWKHEKDSETFISWLTNPKYTRYNLRNHIAWRPSLYGLTAIPLCVAAIGVTQLNRSEWAHFKYPTKGFILKHEPIVQ